MNKGVSCAVIVKTIRNNQAIAIVKRRPAYDLGQKWTTKCQLVKAAEFAEVFPGIPSLFRKQHFSNLRPGIKLQL